MTATQKAMAKAAKQLRAIQAMLDAARFEDGVSAEDKSRAAVLTGMLIRAESAAENGANPLPEGPTRSQILEEYLSTH